MTQSMRQTHHEALIESFVRLERDPRLRCIPSLWEPPYLAWGFSLPGGRPSQADCGDRRRSAPAVAFALADPGRVGTRIEVWQR